MDLLKKADRNRYGALLTGIRDKFALGIDCYPKSLNEACNIVKSYATTHKLTSKRKKPYKKLPARLAGL